MNIFKLSSSGSHSGPQNKVQIREENGAKFQKEASLSLEAQESWLLWEGIHYPEWILKDPDKAAGVYVCRPLEAQCFLCPGF